MRIIALFVAGLLVAPVIASQPGQPLDCSDWVSVTPGFHCDLVSPDFPSDRGGNLAMDSSGRYVWVAGGQVFVREPISGTTVEIGHIDGRLNTDDTADLIKAACGNVPIQGCWNNAPSLPQRFTFDPHSGSLYFPATAECERRQPWAPACQYAPTARVFRISGFATTFDILQTFTPSANALGFRVPYMPEGLPAADRFDTYYGPLTNPIDFSQAQGLACDYPAAMPAVGHYLEVADMLPNPAPGTGRYYVTAATCQGQTRYGRKTTNRVMSGRDPAILPGCASR